MEAKTSFEKAAEVVRDNSGEIDKKPDKEKLDLYALFKQSTVGDVNIPKPGMFALKDKAKWEAWTGKKGMTKEKAMEEYVALAKKLLPTAAF